ncbi:MAG: CsiV family protein [Gammaproteobacteria bacterium]
MKLLKLIAYTLAGLFLLNSHAHAWYQVEIIVFEYLSSDTGGEYWDSEPGLVSLSNTVIPVPAIDIDPEAEEPDDETVLLETPAQTLVPYMLMPDDRYRLAGIFQNLRLSGNYRPLYHASWQQPAVDGNLARAVHLQEIDGSSLFELTMPPRLVTKPMPTEFYEPIKLVFDGTVRVRSSALLHVDIDMVLFREPPFLLAELDTDEVDNMGLNEMSLYTDEDDNTGIKEIPPAYVRLQETRRIRLNELHYFDHPMFGIILQVSRFEPGEAE